MSAIITHVTINYIIQGARIVKEPKEYSTVELINRTIDRIEALQSKVDIYEESVETHFGQLKEKYERKAKFYGGLLKVNKSVLAHLVYTSNKVSYVYI